MEQKKAMRVIVLAGRNAAVVEDVKRVLREAGVALRSLECRDWSASDWQVHVEFPLPEPQRLDAILRAVEAVKGVAVMAAAEVAERRS